MNYRKVVVKNIVELKFKSGKMIVFEYVWVCTQQWVMSSVLSTLTPNMVTRAYSIRIRYENSIACFAYENEIFSFWVSTVYVCVCVFH